MKGDDEAATRGRVSEPPRRDDTRESNASLVFFAEGERYAAEELEAYQRQVEESARLERRRRQVKKWISAGVVVIAIGSGALIARWLHGRQADEEETASIEPAPPIETARPVAVPPPISIDAAPVPAIAAPPDAAPLPSAEPEPPPSRPAVAEPAPKPPKPRKPPKTASPETVPVAAPAPTPPVAASPPVAAPTPPAAEPIKPPAPDPAEPRPAWAD
jgi:hypothetical protein